MRQHFCSEDHRHGHLEDVRNGWSDPAANEKDRCPYCGRRRDQEVPAYNRSWAEKSLEGEG